jgi:adenosine kinase
VRIVVSGALAYDYIMDFPGDFADRILLEKVYVPDVSLLLDSIRQSRGE